jgi:uncharacterized membrane protein YgcG
LPGSPFFPIQNIAEQAQARLQSPAEQQTQIYFSLVERRLDNLVALTGTPREIDNLQYLNEAIDQAILSWSSLPASSADSMRERFIYLILLSDIVINSLEVAPTHNPELVGSLLAKLATLQKLAEDPSASPILMANLADGAALNMKESPPGQMDDSINSIDPLAVPFPAGSFASQHDFYPLLGRHAEIECADCHSDGVYDGTPNFCEACHREDLPRNHFTGDCATCHSAFSWGDVILDHTLVGTDCLSCHAAERPANHYGNQCVACHNTLAWLPATFNHQVAGANNCQSCHLADKPANHFEGQCSRCHSTNTWQGASFNHNGQTNCQSCHSGDRPANHFGGQCSACHSTNTWRGANFNHNGQTDCQSCHTGDRPSNHFSGQCSQCHSTNDWDAEFTHSGQVNCVSCHANDRPRDHSNNQCSQCHNTNNWDADDDDHDGNDGGDGDDSGGNDENGGGDDGGGGNDDGGGDEEEEDEEDEKDEDDEDKVAVEQVSFQQGWLMR